MKTHQDGFIDCPALARAFSFGAFEYSYMRTGGSRSRIVEHITLVGLASHKGDVNPELDYDAMIQGEPRTLRIVSMTLDPMSLLFQHEIVCVLLYRKSHVSKVRRLKVGYFGRKA